MRFTKNNIAEYLYNKRVYAADDYIQLRENVWYRRPDEIDLLEQIMAKVRLDVINEVVTDIFSLYY